MTVKRTIGGVLGLFVLLGVVGVTASPAQAAFLGKNGYITFSGGPKSAPSDIWIVMPDGTGLVNMTRGNGLRDHSPTVSPEGGPHIAWVGEQPKCRRACPGDIFVVDSYEPRKDEFNATRSPDWDDRSPSWAPHGGRIVFSRAPVLPGGGLGDHDIWYMNWTGDPESLVRVTSGAANDIEPAYSPRNREVAFSSNRDGAYGIYVMTPRGEELRRVAANGRDPNWSPLATHIAFVRDGNVWTMQADGSNQRQMTDSGIDAEPAYSPDLERIVFQRGKAVMSMRLDGTGLRRVSRDGFRAAGPDWRPVCHLLGTLEADRLVGTDAPELICGLKGDDVIISGGGDDRIFGGEGADDIDSGDGDDFVLAGNGVFADVINGGAGDDFLMGTQGDDTIVAGPGTDIMLGGPGDDLLNGKDGVFGNDMVNGESKEEVAGDTCTGDVSSDRRPPRDLLMSCEHEF